MEESNDNLWEIQLNDWQVENVIYSALDTYRTSDGAAFFLFGFLFKNNQVQVDILHMPKFLFIDNDILSKKLERSCRGGFKVRIPENSSFNQSILKKFLENWSEEVWTEVKSQNSEII